MSFLFDTNVISELRKGKACDRNVARWHRGVTEDEIYMSVLVLGEIRKGAEKIRRRDPMRARAIEDWMVALSVALGDRVLPVTAEIADVWGRMSTLRTVPIIDSLLAATAKGHGLTIVTRNVSDFVEFDIAVLNPFAP